MSLTGKYLERFLARIVRGPDEDACWSWDGAHFAQGYAETWDGARPLYAHRVAHEIWVGKIPAGYEVDHLCHTMECQLTTDCPHRECINPKHLIAVPPRDNNMRSNSMSAQHARKTHCRRGHPYDEKNTHITPRGSRSCRACWTIDAKIYQEKKKAENPQPSKAHADKTHCPHGHPYDEENTYHYVTSRGGPGRMCRTCSRERAAKRRRQE